MLLLSIYPPKFVIKIFNSLLEILCLLVRHLLAWIHRGTRRIVPRIQNPILLKSATDLAKGIRERKLKSEDVVLAYVQRIQEVEPYINATVERVFEDAIAKAREVDDLVASGTYTKEQLAKDKPFLGVPISIKNIISVKGVRITAGSKFFQDFVASEDAPCVSLMKDAGAIVIATTNTPESGLHIESTNLVHGRTRNPYDTTRMSGGSSGGEAALVAAGGSVLGIGNDLLGSIRIPCHLTGLFGHKPSLGLVPSKGTVPVFDDGMYNYISTGPMCRYAQDLVTSMKVLSSQSDVQVNFEKPVNFKKLKICYMLELQDIACAPVEKEITVSLKKALSYFQNQYGTPMKEVQMPYITNINLMVLHILLFFCKDLKQTLTGGKGTHMNVTLELLKSLFGKTTSLRFSTLIILNFLKLPFYNKAAIPYYKDMLKKLSMWFDDILDEDTVLFLPTFPVTATYHEEAILRLPSAGYTGLFNFLGYPSTQCPLGFNKAGLPYGMQVIGKLHNDPLTIACAVELEKAFGGWVQPENTKKRA